MDSKRSEHKIESKTKSETKSSGRRKYACVECRQQKSKCDAHETMPNPCSKCAKKRVPCVLKKDFRRTYKRARNEAIEKRFRELTDSLSSLSSKDILKRLEEERDILLEQNGSSFGSNERKTNTRFTNSTPIILPSPGTMSESQLHCSPKTLGDIYMSSKDIAELFQEYATHYHQFLPVVDLTKGAERIYTLSPCLFWVILLTALRRKFGASELMSRLSILVKSILAEITISPIIRYTPTDKDEPILNIASVYSVQAFLLYTFWPPLASSLSADTSWNTIGTAMFQALRVGLNSAEYSTEYVSANSELIHEQIRTWICCNIVSQIVASSFGFPAYVSFDHSVLNSAKDSNLPNPLKHMIRIVYFENQITNTLNSTPTSSTGLVNPEEKQPLIQVLNQQLNHLEYILKEDNFDDIRKFELLVAKVHLLTYYFTDGSSTHHKNDNDLRSLSITEIEANFEIKRGLVKVYNAAIELLFHTNEMWKRNPGIVKYFPGVFVLNIWQSACIISKLIYSSLMPVLDIEKGKKAYQDAVTLTLNASILKHDMAYRFSGIMRSIWNLFANMFEDWQKDKETTEDKIANDFNLGITVKSRMSVSVFFDCLYILKEKSGMAKLKRDAQSTEQYGEQGSSGEITSYGGDIHSRRLSDNATPEEKARQIIKTIPLDPHPINPGNSRETSRLTTPNSPSSSDVLSLRGILNKPSPKDTEFILPNTNVLSLFSNNNEVKVGSIDDTVANASLSKGTFQSSGTTDPLRHENGTQLPPILQNNVLPVPINAQVQPNAIGNSELIENPITTSMMDSWDNWESESVWKDVDLLMNEFAFNPTM
ncbi:uncharacterized protein NDAI_0J00440 [Naumovozyma dairenensis CBS 421]|uniref:Zn(2)-C6 fungal-type domain-containing protein n=1 Tax=Naumovozyma dairenensis (strain ATCC 10597 / BCRC 20456 / CBS 421 / NBRC 0211 / NRRL Y-12639) TaxID=1071378 RepID=G0WGK8_NAUDC|nr:hypothetical protein NDAI_0J00440 [Naumovozyma dairenensis CBS 421]CCD26936.1 hypothetical protein NDAI_0J00440 [Naumovozyma dairenensis CBS 421]